MRDNPSGTSDRLHAAMKRFSNAVFGLQITSRLDKKKFMVIDRDERFRASLRGLFHRYGLELDESDTFDDARGTLQNNGDAYKCVFCNSRVVEQKEFKEMGQIPVFFYERSVLNTVRKIDGMLRKHELRCVESEATLVDAMV